MCGVGYWLTLSVHSARRRAAARKVKQLKGEDTDDDNTEPIDDDLLAEMALGNSYDLFI